MVTKKDRLALLGGQPVRKKPFASPVVVDNSEKKALLSVVKNREFSRFMGSPSSDIEKQLKLKSKDAQNYHPQYFLFLGGKKVRKFEADFAGYFKVKYAISVNSATSGLMAALGALKVGPGDEVITTCLSFNATAISILAFNAIPVFVDVEKSNSCLDPQQIEKKISRKTKAILVVHLLGNSCDMDAIMKIAKRHNLKVIEDCAQAPGVRYKGRYVGTIGNIGVFSFQETKNIMTGEGGMIVTNNADLALRCRLIRNHGESIPDANSTISDLVNNIGFNFRMTELTAALGIEQLKKLKLNNRIRGENARYLARELAGLTGIEILPASTNNGNVCHIFPLIYHSKKTGIPRDAIIKALRQEGIPVGSGYLRLMPENPIFLKKIAYGDKGCPFSCRFYNKQISYRKEDYPVASDLIYHKFIWIYQVNRPNTLRDMEDIVKAFRKIFQNLDKLRNYKLGKQKKVFKW